MVGGEGPDRDKLFPEKASLHQVNGREGLPTQRHQRYHALGIR